MSVADCRCYKSFRFLLLFLCLPLLAAGVGCGSPSAGTGTSTKVLTAIAASPTTASIAVGATEQFKAMATYSDGTTSDVTSGASWTDANAKVATITPSGDAMAVAMGSTKVTATMDGVSGSATLTVSAASKTVTAIAVSPATANIAAGATQQFTAKATYSDSSTGDVTATVAWTTSNAVIAKINAAGLATALASGSATVTATLSGVSGNAALTVPVTPPPVANLVSIAVSPGSPTIPAKATQQFMATGTYSDGSTQNVTATANWVSSKTAVATVNASGLATAIAAGPTTITASLSGVVGTATLTVTPIVTSISVSPNPASIAVGATEQFNATAHYSDGSTKSVTATWTVGSTKVATVNASGLATAVASGSTTVTASFSGISGSANLTVSGLTISISPNPATFAVGATQQFTATATPPGGSATDVTALATWSIANTAVATITPNGGLATSVAGGSTTVTATYNGATGTAPVTVTIPAGTGVNVLTWHVDNNRSGLNPNETSLTPSNVAPKTFGKLFSYAIDGYAYAEPLLVSNLTINGNKHNVLYVTTEKDMVYAFDADSYGTGAPLWQISLLQSGETPLTGSDVAPFQGVTSTPVIDSSTNTIYVVSSQKSSANGSFFRLSALDITTGAQKFGGPITIQASVNGTNSTEVGGKVSLPGGCIQRAALLLANGNVYLGFGSCHSGWLLSYNAKTLTQNGVFNASPNIDGEGTYGGAGGVWMGSGGPIADSAGNIYISTGNGPYDTTQGSYSDSILKFNPTLTLLDHFTPQDFEYMNCEDSDLAAGGLMMIPGSGQIVGGGKMGKLYLVNAASLGGEQTGDAGAAQTIYLEQNVMSPYTSAACPDNIPTPGSTHTAMINSYEIFGTAAYFNGSIYLGATPTATNVPTGVRRFGYSAGSPAPLTAQESTSPYIQENTRGTTPFISANGTSDGILWMIDEGQPLGSSTPTKATLRAYDAGNLGNDLYNSSTNSGDIPGYGIKFSSPVVANGKVYISTGHDLVSASDPQGEIDVYGLK